jgi:hypothetical protein
MFGDLEQILLGRSWKSLVFLKDLIFSAVTNFKFRHMFSCTFAIIQILNKIGSTVYFLGDFNEIFRLLFVHTCIPIYGCAKFHWKISKNKICHFRPLWNIFFITEWIALKFKILTDIKISYCYWNEATEVKMAWASGWLDPDIQAIFTL